MKKPNQKIGRKLQSLPRSSPWLWFGVVALLAVCLAGAIYMFKGRGGSATEQQTDPHSTAHSSHHSTANGPRPEVAGGGSIGVNQSAPPGPAPEGMVWVPGGAFHMGCADCEMPDAQPVHLVAVDGFWMDRTPVTNAQFEKFVKVTGYLTIAERQPDPKDYPGADPKNLAPGSIVFTPPARDVPLDNAYVWWRYVPGASWKHPLGPGSSVKGREDHPAVHIAWEDAAAYAKWAGRRLPTEAEFEFAARGGLDGKHYAWGDELKPGGKWAANIWQGRFPAQNTGEDGFIGASPVTAFPPNGFGLYDVGGNVWQWCSDWYRPDYYAKLAAEGVARNPQGPEDSFDPTESGVQKRVQRSGSFLCSDQYCSRFLVGSRGKGAADSGSSNVGFRCAKSAL